MISLVQRCVKFCDIFKFPNVMETWDCFDKDFFMSGVFMIKNNSREYHNKYSIKTNVVSMYGVFSLYTFITIICWGNNSDTTFILLPHFIIIRTDVYILYVLFTVFIGIRNIVVLANRTTTESWLNQLFVYSCFVTSDSIYLCVKHVKQYVMSFIFKNEICSQ